MSEYRWTEQQSLAITTRGESLIVSAAAGSGKTAVLANRVAEFIKNGGSCQRLLVVTFTRLAAGEMRDRIISILDAIQNPSEHIREQKLLLHSARISTIDSYLGEIVRSNFKDLDIPPDYGIIDSVEYGYIKAKAMEELTDEYRNTYKNGFEHVEKVFGGEINDKKLTETINSVYSFLQTIPFGEKWTELCELRYESSKFWTDAVCDELLYVLEDYEKVYDEVLDAQPFEEKGMAVVESEYAVLKQMLTCVRNKDWDGCCQAANYSFFKSPPCKNGTREMLEYSLFRNDFKKLLSSEIFLMDSREALKDAEYLKGFVHCIFAMVKDYGNKIFSEMKKKGMFSFDAVSKMALQLMVSQYDHASGEYVISELAKNISNEFDEILIDEYQDVNDLQDLLFSAISRDNCFCVGDVKQSIYGFRHANPKNFIRKRDVFRNIPLNMNFRSRAGVLEFANFVFSQLFSAKVGDTEYDEVEKLNPGAVYPDTKEPEVEVKYLTYLKTSDEDKKIGQARFVAREIKRIMSSGMTVSGKSGIRPVDYGDFAVLLRKTVDVLPIYERVFYEEDVPCYSKASGSFVDSIEVNTVLAYLKVIDNPYDDAALFAVMYSRLYEFSADKMASLRTESSFGKKGRLYDSLLELGENDPDFGSFVADLKRFRLRSVGFPVHTLIWDIYNRTSYLAKVLPLPLGNIKRDSLMSFYSFARDYGDRTGGGTLSGFVDFAEKMMSSNSSNDLGSMPNGNFVKILTIHASKGLEFPVCIVPELNRLLENKDFNKQPVYIDESLGISASRFSENYEYTQKTLMNEIIKMKLHRDNISESLRLLYVAFTRAKEKLVLISPGDIVSASKLQEAALLSDGKGLFKSQVNSASSFENLITATLCRHKEATVLHSDLCDILPSNFHVNVENVDVEPVRNTNNNRELGKNVFLDITFDELDERFFKKDLPKERIPLKVSVSELTDDESAAQMYETELTYKDPLFISGKPLMGAGKGSAIHLYMQLSQLGKGVHSEAKRMLDAELLTQDQFDAVMSESYRIDRFENSVLYSQALAAKNVYREESFFTEIPATEYSPEAAGNETLLIQGSIDMLCEYDDGFVIIDYKTDRIDEEELISRYEKQLKLYRLAVEKNYGKPVKKCLIWSFWLSKEIEIL